MPDGSIMGRIHAQRYRILCAVNPYDVVRVNAVPVPGAKIVSGAVLKNHYEQDSGFLSDVYTTPELELRGLGYVVYRGYASSQSTGVEATVRCDSTRSAFFFKETIFPAETTQPMIVKTVPNRCPGFGHTPSLPVPNGAQIEVLVTLSVFFVKIGDSSQHAVLPQAFSAPLFSVALYGASGIPEATHTAVLNITDFSSQVLTRTCTTPQASESTIYFGMLNQQDIQWMVPGTTTAQREFTVTFTCPYGMYSPVSFFVEPMYGESSQYPGTMNIAAGAGMAQGVGVKLEKFNGYSWGVVVYRTDPLSNTGFAEDSGKYVLQDFGSSLPINTIPEPPRQQVIQFRASLIRLNDPVVAGQIKAAALIHIRYN